MTVQHIFFDTNVLLDYFLAREPQGMASAQILNLAAIGKIKASTSAVSFCNVAYILGKVDKSRGVERDLQQLLDFVHIVPNTSAMMGAALIAPLPDIEDAVQYVSAMQASCSHLITSNKKHFKKCAIKVMDPWEYISGVSVRASRRSRT